MVPIVGTAVHEDFKFYKLEYGVGASPVNWSYFDGARARSGRPARDAERRSPAPGTYSIRVVVVDSTGNFPTPCET